MNIQIIRVYSQDEIKGKTLEYDLMWYNSVSDLLFLEDLSNKKELEEIQSEDYPACAEKLRNSSENKRIKEALNLCTWTNEDKKKALLASRYLNSIGKGENALALSVILKNNLEKQSTERKDFIVPKYIKDALVWLLQ